MQDVKIPGMYREKKLTDPYNAFDNEMENSDYNQNYSDILPDIKIPDTKIPLKPSRAERKNILHYYNIAGALLLLFALISNFLPALLELAVQIIVSSFEASKGADIHSIDYTHSLYDWMSKGSSVEIGIVTIIHVVFNTLIALWGLKLIKVKPVSLIEGKDYHVPDLLKYSTTAVALSYAMSIIVTLITDAFSKGGVDLVEVDMDNYFSGPLSAVLSVLYICIAAPVTEELVFRGFALKALSRVSQRFAIFVTSLLFGLIHANVAQFCAAFVLGLFFAHIVTKHNSIIPSIICHIAVNSVSEISMFMQSQGKTVFTAIVSLILYAIMAAGIVFLVLFLMKNRLPYNTQAQSMRSTGIVFLSPCLILTFLTEIGFIIYTNIQNNM